MAIQFRQDSTFGSRPSIWRGDCKVLPGGFAPATTFANGTIVKTGTPLVVNFTNMTAEVAVSATVVAGGTTSAPRVAKGSFVKVGDKVIKTGGAANSAVTVSAVDRSNAGYDVVTLSGAISGLTAGNVVLGVDASGTAIAPNAVACADTIFDGNGIKAYDAAYSCALLENAIDTPIPAEWRQGITLAKNPNIVLIRQ